MSLTPVIKVNNQVPHSTNLATDNKFIKRSNSQTDMDLSIYNLIDHNDHELELPNNNLNNLLVDNHLSNDSITELIGLSNGV